MERLFVPLLVCFAVTAAYQSFQNRIPNGDLVPHPCKPNYLWKGVGHLNVLGGGERNPFGKDFSKYGRTWNRELCQMDSDGDGRSNGQELGDPGCIWNPQGGAPTAAATGHPGVCEPIDSELCKAVNGAAKENWEFCEQGEFKCDAIMEPDVQDFTVKIASGTKIPAQETTYMCQLVKLPDDQQYHIIATEPAIDNEVVAHHMIVYGCDERVLDTLSHYSSPQICNSMAIYEACEHSVGGWTVGQSGYCEVPNVGRRFGKRVFNYAVIEIHWNNPMEVDNYVDGSGLTIYYTPNLRKYDAETLTIGQQSLAIPPNVDTHYQSAVCTSDCTKYLKQPIYIYGLNLHMHYLGRSGRVEHWRDGSLLQVLADEEAYSYDNPIDYQLDPPAIFEAGDELKMFCKFKSKSKNEVTYYGEGTSDEMCFAFLNYFPKTEFSYCTAYGPLDTCSGGKDDDPESMMYMAMNRLGCDMSSYEEMIGILALEAAEVCGYENPECTPECRDFFERAYAEKPCLRNGLRFVFEGYMLLDNSPETAQLIELLRVCDKLISPVNAKLQYYEKNEITTNGATGQTPLALAVTSVLAVILFLRV